MSNNPNDLMPPMSEANDSAPDGALPTAGTTATALFTRAGAALHVERYEYLTSHLPKVDDFGDDQYTEIRMLAFLMSATAGPDLRCAPSGHVAGANPATGASLAAVHALVLGLTDTADRIHEAR